jgi:hypothetical protein
MAMRVDESPAGLSAVCKTLGNRYPEVHLTQSGSVFNAKQAGQQHPISFSWPYWAADEGPAWRRATDDLEDWIRRLLGMDPFQPIESVFTFVGTDGKAQWVQPKTIAVRVSPFRLEFKGGPTGFEVYRLEPGLLGDLEAMTRAEREATFCICAGTPGSWPTCTVRAMDVLQAIQRAQERMDSPHGAQPMRMRA